MENSSNKLSVAVIEKVAEHYEHAKEKHPFFAHGLFLEGDSASDAEHTLAQMRMCLKHEKNENNVLAETVLNCEISEAAQAYASGDKAHAVEECYDSIAVLLRMIDAIDGREPLAGDAE